MVHSYDPLTFSNLIFFDMSQIIVDVSSNTLFTFYF